MIEKNKIYCMDCLEGMKEMDKNSVDLIVTDPPYQLNTTSAYGGKLNPWADLCNSAYWFAELFREYFRLIKPSGAVWQFCNWRSLPTLQKAVFDAGSKIEDVLIWDKIWIGPGGCNGLRPSYEMVILVCGESFSIGDRGIPDIYRCLWSGKKPTTHPAEKPKKLIRWLIEISGGQLILDPFMGSGTTAVACKELGRDYIGFEIDEGWVELANQRLSQSHLGFYEPEKEGLGLYTN